MTKPKTMRITGGHLLRKRFLLPPMVDEGTVRPTPDRVREAVFSMIKDHISGSSVLDIFAGSGAHGYESISRGAKDVHFIEKDPRVLKVIKENISALGITSQCKTTLADAIHAISKPADKTYDIIFVDPPYTLTLDEQFFFNLINYLAKDGMVIFRCFKKEAPNIGNHLRIEKERTYAGTKVFIMTH